MREFKNTVWGLAVQLLGVFAIVIVVNLLLLLNLTSVVDHPAWEWFVTGMTSMILYVILWITAAQQGKKDVDLEELNRKRKEKNDQLTFPKQYIPWKGFAAGGIVMIPALIMLLAINVFPQFDIGAILLRLAFSVHIKSISLWGTHPLAMIVYMLMFAGICGGGYMTGPRQKEKLKTIIRRNEEKSNIKK